jgi:hypothetical protein
MEKFSLCFADMGQNQNGAMSKRSKKEVAII